MDIKQVKGELFGYHKRQVKNYIRRINQLQSFELEEMRNKIIAVKQQNQELRKQFDLLQLQKKDCLMIPEIEILLEQRLPNGILAIQRQGELELAGIKMNVKEKQVSHTKKIQAVTEQINHYNVLLHSLLQEFSNSLEKFMNEELSTEKEIAVGESVSNESDPALKSAKVIQFKMQSFINENDQNVENMQTEVIRTGTENIGVLQDKNEIRRLDDNLNTPSLETETVVHGSQFWGGIQSYMGASMQSSNTLQNDDQHSFWDSSELFSQPEGSTDTETGASDNQNNEPDSKKLAEVKMAHKLNDIPKESPALSEEIEAVRNRYIVGKLSGIDLYDHSGSLIVGKNQTITGEIVEKADQEGKLADLIVHMIMPGMRDENG